MYDCECGSKNALRESSETKKANMIISPGYEAQRVLRLPLLLAR